MPKTIAKPMIEEHPQGGYIVLYPSNSERYAETIEKAEQLVSEWSVRHGHSKMPPNISRDTVSDMLLARFKNHLADANLYDACDVCTLNTIRDIAEMFGLTELAAKMSRLVRDAMA